jgi:hypothetical protein
VRTINNITLPSVNADLNLALFRVTALDQQTSLGMTRGPLTLFAATSVVDVAQSSGFRQTGSYIENMALVTSTGATEGALVFTFEGSDGVTNIVDASTNAYTVDAFGGVYITNTPSPFGYAAAFDGATTYLQIQDGVIPELGANDFTFETWFYNSGAGVECEILSRMDPATSFSTLRLAIINNNLSLMGSYDGSDWNIYYESVAPVVSGQWHHAACCVSSSYMRVWMDGTQVVERAISSLWDSDFAWTIGASTYSPMSRFFQGYMAQMRLVLGTALYTNDFSPAAFSAGSSSYQPTNMILTLQPYSFLSAPDALLGQLYGTEATAGAWSNVAFETSVNAGINWTRFALSPDAIYYSSTNAMRSGLATNLVGSTGMWSRIVVSNATANPGVIRLHGASVTK